MPAKSQDTLAGKISEDQLPAFNPNTLSSLTQKIESNLKKHSNGELSQSSPAKVNAKKYNKKKSNEHPSAEAPVPSTASKISNGKSQNVGKQKATTAPKPSQGKKRLRDGSVKAADHQKHGDRVNKIKLGARIPKSTAGENSDIEEEIGVLGGTKNDVDLVADAPSDSEVEGRAVELGDALREDLKRELKSLVRQGDVNNVGKREQTYNTEPTEEHGDYEKKGRGSTVKKVSPKKSNDVQLKASATKPLGKKSKSLFSQPQSEWHSVELPNLPTSPEYMATLPLDLVDRLQAYAKSLLENENEQYAAHNTSASSAHQFYSTIMSTGTLSDKISALTLSVQESPIHNMKALESLVTLARKRSRGQAVEVLGALKDLFGPGNLLPSERKLRAFAAQPALSAAFDSTDFHWTSKDPLPRHLKEIHLISWAFEDWLKTTFFEVLKIIETWCNDEVVFARGKAVDYVCQLLKEKPEQEGNLLRLLVNKLGDSDKKIASKTSFNILQLETIHPLMKPTIISAIESDLLFRPGQSLHAKYYATITLNQTVLSGKEEGVARKLLDIYFSLFIKLLEKPEPAKPAATGVNNITINKKGEVQGGGGAGGKKALKKLAEKEKATTVDDELREKMLSAVLTGVNRSIPFTNTNDESFERHLDTLFKVTHSSNFNTSIQALMLIQQLNGSHQGSVDRFYRTLYESLLDPRLLTSSKQALYLNLLFRALRSDLNVKRVKAFAKRLLQVVAMHQPSFTCGTLYLLRELEGVFASLESFMDQPEGDSDDEENFKDVQEATLNDHDSQKELPHAASSFQTTKSQKSLKYDGRKRDPEFTNADRSSLWELTPFIQHYHPSVALFAIRLLTHDPMPPKPDLSLNTLIHFLDRFVYRNPKAASASKGVSIMQPMAGGDSSALLVSAYSNKEKARQPVNSEAFWKQESGKVNADEVFFHKYFSTLGRGKEKSKKRKADKKKGEDEDSESEGDEDEIWKALVDSRPELDDGSDGAIFSEDDMGSDMEDLENEGGVEFDEGGENADDLDDAVDNDSIDLEDDDDEALLDSDDEVPSHLDDVFNAEARTGEKKPTAAMATTVEAPEEGEKRSKKRRRLKNLPTFASAGDYAKMVDEDD